MFQTVKVHLNGAALNAVKILTSIKMVIAFLEKFQDVSIMPRRMNVRFAKTLSINYSKEFAIHMDVWN